MSRVRVQIDLNAFDAEGLTRTRLKNSSGPLEAGRMVVAYEPEDESMFLALVDHVDESTGYAFLRVNWDSMQDDVSGTSLATAFEPSLERSRTKSPRVSWSEVVKQVSVTMPATQELHFGRTLTA